MSNELEAFVEQRSGGLPAISEEVRLDLLVLTQGPLLFGIHAAAVDSVVTWQVPTPLPQSNPHLLGVVQDRGRLVAVRREEMIDAPRRLVICKTSRGLVGFAATETRSVGTVIAYGRPTEGVPMETSAGAITLIDPEAFARHVTQR